jgi:hypothetical protein
MVDGKQVQYQIAAWGESRELVLGRQVYSYETNGRPAKQETVLKALTRPAGVACFVQYGVEPDEPEAPDPFYLRPLREGSIVLVLHGKDLFPPAKPTGKTSPPAKP